MIDYLIDPFTHYAFMRRALAACVVLAIGGTPLGVFMSLRRMTLVGDAMAHAILPGVALGFVCFGFSVWPMTIGGALVGVTVALLAGLLTRYTQLKEDASLTMFYLLSLAAGVVMISLKGNSVDLLHLLFGNILAIDNDALYLVSGIACLSLFALAFFYRGLVISSFDPAFAQTTPTRRDTSSVVFFVLLAINMIAAFQALGTLMALGLLILPAIAARFWTRNIDAAIPLSILCALIAAPIGLLLSYYTQVPSGPAVVLIAGGMGLLSSLIGRRGSVLAYLKNWD